MNPILHHSLLFTSLLLLHTVPTPLASPLQTIDLDSTQSTNYSQDFGRIVENSPISVLQPTSLANISVLLQSIYSSPTQNNVTVAARGNGHATFGQAEAEGGIVIDMRSLPSSIRVDIAYVDAGGGALWVDVLNETLKHGFSPMSWTDYLYITVGGTLSNAGISGQTFKYGPQISNVIELDVMTGKGEQITCSMQENSEIFYGVLGGLGQFGIITRARIPIEPAPIMAKFVLIPYDDFNQFTKQEEFLISSGEVDYLEGTLNFLESNPYYVIELAIYYNDNATVEKQLDQVLSLLGVLRSTVNESDLSYFEFLNRVKREEDALRKLGLWDVRHPWLNFFVPKAQIVGMKDQILDTISANYSGIIKVYPILKNKWNRNMSAMLPEVYPEEDIVYAVGLLQSVPLSCVPGSQCLDKILTQNKKIIDSSTAEPTRQVRQKESRGGMGVKQYLPDWKNKEDWRGHFGSKWDQFNALKEKFDPLHILAPGQGIFKRKPIEGVM